MKKAIILTLAILLIFTVAACGNGGGSGARAIPDLDRITRELTQDGRSIIPREETISSVEINTEDTDRDNWIHRADVTIHSQDSDIAYIRYAIMTYNRDEDREWILSGISADKLGQWAMSPLTGVKNDLIESAVKNLREQFNIDNDNWIIDANSVEDISIANQNTDLQNRKDNVVVDVVLGAPAMIAKGQIELNFTFDNGWAFNNQTTNTQFTSELRQSAEFDLMDDRLIDDILQNTDDLYFNGGVLEITRSNISNLSIGDYDESNKGAYRSYTSTFNVENGLIVFEVETQAIYSFDMGGWNAEAIHLAPKVESVALEGTKWAGSYSPGWAPGGVNVPFSQDRLVIEITEVNNGNVKATITATEPEFSQTSIGTFDINTLTLNLIFDEWIIEPSVEHLKEGRRLLDRQWENVRQQHAVNITGRLSNDSSTITSSSGVNFEVSIQR